MRANVAPVRQAQVLDIEGTGVAAPVGLAFAARSQTFYVLGAPSSGSASAVTDVVTLTPLESASVSSRVGSSHTAPAIQDPINIAFDAHRSRMLFMGHAGELLEVPVRADGRLDTVEPKRHDAALFGLEAPNGMAVDPASGVVFIGDANVPRIVRVEPQSGQGFDNAATSELDLGSSGIGGVTGLAFDPSTGHLQLRDGESLYELTTAGEVVAVRDLAGLDLVTPEGMVIAPSTDQTDDPSTTSVYVADSGGGATQASGKIVELSLAPLAAAAIDFTSQLVSTVDMGALSPPSPDPSGITHVPGTGLVVSDAEVEETVTGITHFQGANVWELSLSGVVQRTANISNVPPTVAPVTNEPAGIAFNPNNGHYFVSADDAKRVFDIDPGADGLLGTADDSSTFFNTDALNQDPEGIAYSTFSGNLFVADGASREVFQYTTGGALVGNFDVLQYGINDPNSVEFNPDSGTLLVLSDRNSGTGNQRLVVETTTNGTLVRTIDVGASNAFRPDGVAYAPASDGTGAPRFYIVDRVLDNNLDPNAVDGKLYEMTAPAPGAPANTPPVVSAGPDQSAALPASANLDGTVTDDGNPPPGALTTNWTQVSGPGTITFGDASMVDTTASATIPGVYVVRLTASDSEFSASDEATLTFTGTSSVQTLDVSVSAGSDDAEESTANVVVIGSADLDLMTGDEANLVVGARFTNVTLPAGANITSAFLQLTAEEAPHSSATSLTVRGQAADNPPTFAAVNGDISGRATTAASTAWTVDPWLNIGDAGLAQRSPGLTGIIQEIVNRPGWVSGNALVLLTTGSGTRIAESFNKTATPGGDPLLHVEYTSANSPPQITSDGGGDTAATSVAENQTAVTTVTAVDPNVGDTLTFSISGGADAARFQIGSGTGVLSFVTAPDHESPTDVGANNVYDVTMTVSDGVGGTDSQALVVTVLDVNEFPPVITSDGGGSSAAISRPENQTAVTTVTATDGDADVLTFSISGGDDAARFAINASTGVLTFVSAPDFENPTDVGANNVYDVSVDVSDGSLSDMQAIAVTVTDVIEGGGAGLTVSKAGTGFGTVTGPGIDCGSDCFESYAPGRAVVLTAAAGFGSVFGSWSNCDSPSGTTCTMTMTSSKTVTATFTATPTFADVPPSNPHYEDIEHLFDLGITQGCGTSGGQLLFCPSAFVPREQMAAFLIRAEGLTQLFPPTPTFADVPASDFFFGYVERLFEQGITQGCGTSGGQLLFCPKAFVPREQMAAFLIRAKGLTQLFPPTSTFADVPASNFFFGYVERLFEQGITQGCGTNGSGQPLFCPGDFVPRQQMASFLIRAFA